MNCLIKRFPPLADRPAKHRSSEKRIICLICKTLFCALPLLLLALSSCEKDFSDPVSVQPKTYPAVPDKVNARVGDKVVLLQWYHTSLETIEEFRIYRKDSLLTELALLASCDTLAFTDSNVRNGMAYSYCITAVNELGYEGPPSSEIIASPGVYSVSINNGLDCTREAQVTLNIIGPIGAHLMQINNDSLAPVTSWIPFASTRQWSLSEEDGLKRVFVDFCDLDGNRSAGTIFDEIILDTQAIIYSFTTSIVANQAQSGDTIHFRLQSAEAFGYASLSIGTSVNKRLYDNGTHGDEAANDGIYSLDFIVPPYLQLENAAIIGKFSDRLGNIAEEVTASETLSIFSVPTPVELFDPEPSKERADAVQLAWTVCSDSDFLNYRLYRSTDPRMQEMVSLVAITTDRAQTVKIDSLLQPQVDYYYSVWVTNQQGLTRASNIAKIRLANFMPPAAVELYPPVLTEAGDVALSWEISSATDFASYRLYRSTTDVMTVPIYVAANKSITYYLDSNLQSETLYHYRIEVHNERGLFSGSEMRSILTPVNQPPAAVQLAVPTAILPGSLQLVWSRNRDSDFDSYRLYRSTTAAISTEAAPVAILSTQDSNTTIDQGLESAKTYYYMMVVYDKEGSATPSNIVSGQTLP